MLTIATADNPTAIPPTELRRQRERDELSWSGVRIVWTLSDHDAFLELLEELRDHPNRGSRVSATMERVLIAIAKRQRGQNPDYCPAVEHLARDCRLHKRTVQHWIRRAEALGVLEIRERHREPVSGRATKRATQTSNRYLLLLPEPDQIGEFSVERRQVEVEPETEIVPDELPTGVVNRHPTTERFYLLASSFRGVVATPMVAAIRAGRMRWLASTHTSSSEPAGLQPARPYAVADHDSGDTAGKARRDWWAQPAPVPGHGYGQPSAPHVTR